MKQSNDWYEKFMEHVYMCDEVVFFRQGELVFKVVSNSRLILDTVASYFSRTNCEPIARAIEVVIVEYPGYQLGIDYEESDNFRSIKKLNDGLLIKPHESEIIFLQGESHRVAVGSCEENINVLMNFIVSQYSNELLKENWFECELPCVEISGVGVGLVSQSDVGLSCLFNLLESSNSRFLGHERLYVKYSDGILEARGLQLNPKISRNVISQNKRFHGLLAGKEAEGALDDKVYDLDIDLIFGWGKRVDDTAVQYIICLDWILVSYGEQESHSLETQGFESSYLKSPKTALFSIMGFREYKTPLLPENLNNGDVQIQVLKLNGVGSIDYLVKVVKGIVEP